MAPSQEPVGVLIVDDHSAFRRAAAAVVGITPGFTVVGEAESGEEAVQVAEALRPAVVLMDINLPGMNGIEATRHITQARPETVVILLSTYRAEDLPGDSHTSGFAAYVNKDEFGPEVLRRLVGTHARTRPASAPGGTVGSDQRDSP